MDKYEGIQRRFKEDCDLHLHSLKKRSEALCLKSKTLK